MDYLLDTSACVDAIKNRTPLIRKRISEAMRGGARVYVSSIASFELWYVAAKSASPEDNAKLVDAFLAGASGIISFEEEDARSAGSRRAKLEKARKPIGSYDLLIAGQALRHGMTLVTSNVREFHRVKGLAWTDWARP
ncbi:MAG: VapC toxin family PIN domain ribonuclease [Acidobacteria bacterium]|nr:MAG: VapC toxin family PIN domain ribonuclease [Acidobacteriota bacterium]